MGHYRFQLAEAVRQMAWILSYICVNTSYKQHTSNHSIHSIMYTYTNFTTFSMIFFMFLQSLTQHQIWVFLLCVVLLCVLSFHWIQIMFVYTWKFLAKNRIHISTHFTSWCPTVDKTTHYIPLRWKLEKQKILVFDNGNKIPFWIQLAFFGEYLPVLSVGMGLCRWNDNHHRHIINTNISRSLYLFVSFSISLGPSYYSKLSSRASLCPFFALISSHSLNSMPFHLTLSSHFRISLKLWRYISSN